MENPLNEDQIKKLNEIAKLQGEEQQVELQKFLKTLNEEQVNFLKQHWGKGSECIFCSIIDEKVNSYKIYENEKYVVVLDINPVNEGHCLILPREHLKFINEVDSDIFDVVKKIVGRLYELYKCDSNVLINNGAYAGQKIDHFSISIFPRYKDDGFSISAKTKKLGEDELESVSKKLYFVDRVVKKEVEKLEDYEEEDRIP
ncbi:MAG: HIT family protein [Nanoarchaeota archaeon]|nr:HIT family protein [Nanoarchaeota archaeon]